MNVFFLKKDNFSTRKSSCVTARGVPPAAYHVRNVCYPGAGESRVGVGDREGREGIGEGRVPCLGPGGGERRGYSVLILVRQGRVRGYHCSGFSRGRGGKEEVPISKDLIGLLPSLSFSPDRTWDMTFDRTSARTRGYTPEDGGTPRS